MLHITLALIGLGKGQRIWWGQTFFINIDLLSHWLFTVSSNSFPYQRTIGPVNAHLISRPSKAQNIQNLENI